MKKIILAGFFIFLILLVAGGVIAAKIVGGRYADQKLKAVCLKVKDKATITYDSVSLALSSLGLVVDGVKIATPKGQHFTIAKCIVHSADIEHKPPHYASFSLKGISVPVNEKNFGEEFKQLVDLGYQALTADVFVDFAFEPRAKTFELKTAEFKVHNLGAGALRFKATNVILEELKELVFDNLVIERVHAEYEDKALLGKMVKIASVDEKDILNFLVEGLREDIQRAKQQNNEEAAKTMQELVKFLQNPSALSVKVDLSQPVKVSQIIVSKKISQIVKMFSISIIAG
jgi:hypothetical protein